MTETSSTKNAVWLSRLLRWGLGAGFIAVGIIYFNEGGWPVILFGSVFFATGFFRPKRCIDGNCELPQNKVQYKNQNL